MKTIQKNAWIAHIKAHDHPTPYMLTDLSLVEKAATELQELLPNVKLLYALKSNSDPQVLKRLAKIVHGFDIASIGELELLESIGVDASRIDFSNPVKIPSQIAQAYKKGVKRYALDSFDEVKKLQEHAPGADVNLRIKVINYGSKFPLSSKFGLMHTQVLECALAARHAGLNVKGLTFHVGSQAENLEVWDVAFETCGHLIKQLRELDIHITTVDMGGGFPADYDQPTPTIKKTCKAINRAVKKHLPQDIELVAEPGRSLVANSSVIVASVIARERRESARWLYLDMGAFQGLIEPLEIKDWRYPVFNLSRAHRKSQEKEYVLTGPTCDPQDTIGWEYVLPGNTQMGDKICIAATGAYTLVYGSRFNGFEVPKNYYV